MMVVAGVRAKVAGAPCTVRVRLVAEAALTTPGVRAGWAGADAGAADAGASDEADASCPAFFWHPARAAAQIAAAPASIAALVMTILPFALP